jgi:ABC-type enterobactin transport system permease subunit
LIAHVLVLVAIGAVLGLGGAVTLAQLMRSLLFDVGTPDVPTYAIGAASLFGAAASRPIYPRGAWRMSTRFRRKTEGSDLHTRVGL